jgi:hypothetical protein
MTRKAVLSVAVAFHCMACGTGTASYRGTVTVADVTGYSFDASPNPNRAPTVRGAVVKLAAMKMDGNCAKLWPQELPSGTSSSHPQATTDAGGQYEIVTFFPSYAGETGTFAVCVRRDGFEPFEYIAIEGKSKDPTHGEKFLNVRLKPLTRASTPLRAATCRCRASTACACSTAAGAIPREKAGNSS